MPLGAAPAAHYLDSGSFSMWGLAAEWQKETGAAEPWGFYDTPRFWRYIEAYADFLLTKKYRRGITLYSNVDVIPNPELSYRNQKYLESRGLHPIPVVHYGTDLEWLHFYIDEEYPILALGGLVGSTAMEDCQAWLDEAFNIICDTPERLPRIKTHGFGVTKHEFILRYPWYCVDSTSWTKAGAYGNVYFPNRRAGAWDFATRPKILKMSVDSPDDVMSDRHYLHCSEKEQALRRRWLDEIGVPLGEYKIKRKIRRGKKDKVKYKRISNGVCTDHTWRRAANLLFFEQLRKSIPEYPWSFRVRKTRPQFK